MTMTQHPQPPGRSCPHEPKFVCAQCVGPCTCPDCHDFERPCDFTLTTWAEFETRLCMYCRLGRHGGQAAERQRQEEARRLAEPENELARLRTENQRLLAEREELVRELEHFADALAFVLPRPIHCNYCRNVGGECSSHRLLSSSVLTRVRAHDGEDGK